MFSSYTSFLINKQIESGTKNLPQSAFKKYLPQSYVHPYIFPWTLPLIQISLNGSIWSTVSVTLERYITVVHPRWMTETHSSLDDLVLSVSVSEIFSPHSPVECTSSLWFSPPPSGTFLASWSWRPAGRTGQSLEWGEQWPRCVPQSSGSAYPTRGPGHHNSSPIRYLTAVIKS